MGQMDGYFTLGKQFMYSFPVLVAIFCVCSLLNIWQRIARSSFMKNVFLRYVRISLYPPTHVFYSCWPIKKLKIHIEDPRNILEEGALILKEGGLKSR